MFGGHSQRIRQWVAGIWNHVKLLPALALTVIRGKISDWRSSRDYPRRLNLLFGQKLNWYDAASLRLTDEMRTDKERKLFDIKFFDDLNRNRIEAVKRRNRVQILNSLILTSVVINILGIDFNISFLGISLGRITKYKEVYLVIVTILSVYVAYSQLYTDYLKSLIANGITSHIRDNQFEAYFSKYEQFFDLDFMKRIFEVPEYLVIMSFHLNMIFAHYMLTFFYFLIFICGAVAAHIIIIIDVILNPNFAPIITYLIVGCVIISNLGSLYMAFGLYVFKAKFNDHRKMEELVALAEQDRSAYIRLVERYGFTTHPDGPKNVAQSSIEFRRRREQEKRERAARK